MFRKSVIVSAVAVAGAVVGAGFGWLAHDRWSGNGSDSAWFHAHMADAAMCGITLQALDAGRLGLVRTLLEGHLAGAAEGMDRLAAQQVLDGQREPMLVPNMVAGIEKALEYVRTHPAEQGTAERLDRALVAIRRHYGAQS